MNKPRTLLGGGFSLRFTGGGAKRADFVLGNLEGPRRLRKAKVEPVHSYDAFHTRSDMSGVKGIIGMHRFNIRLVVVLLWCGNTIKG